MAEQLCVGALIGYTHTGVVALARDGMVDLDVPDDGIDVELWVEEYFGGRRPRTAVPPSAGRHRRRGTDHQYGFGRMDYEGMFAVFNEHNDTATGAPHPLAALRMTANEWDDEQRLQRAVGYTAVAVAHTAIAGAARMHSLDSMLPVTPQRQGESTNEAVVVSDLRYTVPSASARRWVASARQPYAR